MLQNKKLYQFLIHLVKIHDPDLKGNYMMKHDVTVAIQWHWSRSVDPDCGNDQNVQSEETVQGESGVLLNDSTGLQEEGGNEQTG